MEQASAALAKTEYFECERLALEALNTAFEAGDFERMARIVLPLQEARRQKRLEALECSTVIRLNEADQELLQEDEQVEAGCYLFEPLLVGADGRDLRERANQQGVPVLVVGARAAHQRRRMADRDDRPADGADESPPARAQRRG